jgi:hypothetical protein
MKLIEAQECRAQAKHCRELAMSTEDAEIEQLFLQTADDLDGQAARMESSFRQSQG